MLRTARFNYLLLLLLVLVFPVSATFAQGTKFTYQGRLTDGGTPANGTYDLQFTLWDALTAGLQQPQPAPITLERPGVLVTSGAFSVQLDFGVGAFPGADRFLELGVRHDSSESYVLLSPRQQLTSAPYAVRSLNSSTADTAANTTQLGGVPAANYVQTDDPRLSDPRPPTAGSANYIQNTSSQQVSSNFNVSGNGTAAGTLSGNVVNATTQYNIGGNRVLGVGGTNNLFVGLGSGALNFTGSNNSFFGRNAGHDNSEGSSNSFFGNGAGSQNTVGLGNSFFGNFAGFSNTTGTNNAFFGSASGGLNTGSDNAFFGAGAGQNNRTGQNNAFFGRAAGFANLDGGTNSFFGSFAGNSNTGGSRNSFFGSDSGRANTTGHHLSFFGESAGLSNDTGTNNSFFGNAAGAVNTSGADNSFFGSGAGIQNTFGSGNSFFGGDAGRANTTGFQNVFVGNFAGSNNTTGSNLTMLGNDANVALNNLTTATAIGAGARVSTSNTLVLGRVADTVQIPGNLNVSGTMSVSATSITGVMPVDKGGTGLSAAGANGNVLTSDGTNWTSVPLSSVPPAGTYIQNTATQQPSSNFNISGDGTAAGTLSANTVNATTQYNIGGERVLSVEGFDNTFTGHLSGASNIGSRNSFFGAFTGLGNSGSHNSFFGRNAGIFNTTGNNNSFFGDQAGQSNNTGGNLTLIGDQADVGTDGLTNATAIGAGATVSQSNSLVLGNNADVGIGTTAPKSRLHVANGYVQIPVKLTAGPPPAADCDAADVAGRMVLVIPDDRLYVCTGAAGWKAAALVP